MFLVVFNCEHHSRVFEIRKDHAKVGLRLFHGGGHHGTDQGRPQGDGQLKKASEMGRRGPACACFESDPRLPRLVAQPGEEGRGGVIQGDVVADLDHGHPEISGLCNQIDGGDLFSRARRSGTPMAQVNVYDPIPSLMMSGSPSMDRFHRRMTEWRRGTPMDNRVTTTLPFLQKGVAQLGFVVKDLDAAVESWWKLFGIGPWHFYTYGKPMVRSMTYHGAPADYRMRLALSWIGPLRIELIEPVQGDTVYQEFIEGPRVRHPSPGHPDGRHGGRPWGGPRGGAVHDHGRQRAAALTVTGITRTSTRKGRCPPP